MKMAGVSMTLMMEAVRSSETLVSIYQTTRCNIAEDGHLHKSVSVNNKEVVEVHITSRQQVTHHNNKNAGTARLSY
jgi:uncharacterized protein YcfL